MITIKGIEKQTDCKKCPFVVHDGQDILNPMMCMAIWATTHEVKHCIEGKIRDDCPLVEIVNCKDCIHWDKHSFTQDPEYHYCDMEDCNIPEDYFCGLGKRRENDL